MALDFLKGAVQGIANKTLKKVAGNLPGLLGFDKGKGKGTDRLSSANSTHKYVTKNLTFPLDTEAPVGSEGNHGHYIMFYINKQQNAKLSFGDPEKKDNSGIVASVKAQQKIPDFIKKLQSDGSYVKTKNTSGLSTQGVINYDAFGDVKSIEVPKIVRTKGSTVTVNRPATTRMDTAIAMYMPQQVQVVYGLKYTDTEIGAGAAIGMNAITDFMNSQGFTGAFDAASNAGTQIKPEAIEGFKRLALAGGDLLLPGAKGLSAANDMRASYIKAPRMELAFEGIGKRQFQYTFKMMPKNQAEADEIRKIIFAFKSNMLPEFLDGNRAGRRLTTPNTFDISYMYNGAENHYLHKISTCVCTNATVAYGGDKYRTFDGIDGDGAPPVDTSLTLNFQELEIITRERVYEGY